MMGMIGGPGEKGDNGIDGEPVSRCYTHQPF